MLEELKLLLGITSEDKDELLELLLTLVTQEAKSYTNLTSTTKLKPAILQMAIFRFNRLGTEGVSSESYAGNSYSYTDSYPETVLNLLDSMKDESKSFKKLVTM